MPIPSFIFDQDPHALAENLGTKITSILQTAIRERDSASLVVSGGSTPKPLFKFLSQQDLAWAKVTVLLADERCVEPDHPDSNSLLVRENLLQGNAAKANFVELFEGGSANEGAQRKAHERLMTLPTYDVVVLGMGNDGHTASIFPEAKERDAALDNSREDLALLTDPVTVSPLRMTQTSRRLLDSRQIFIHFTGAQKAELFAQIMQSDNEALWPISHFAHQNNASAAATVPVAVYADQEIYLNNAENSVL